MQNFLDPAILFFVFGVLAGALVEPRDSESIAKFLSLYLLMALGLKGGFALAQSGFTADVALSLAAALVHGLPRADHRLCLPQEPRVALRRGGGGGGLWLGQRRDLRDRHAVPGNGGPGTRRPHGGGPGDHGIARHHHGGAAGQLDPAHAGRGRPPRRRGGRSTRHRPQRVPPSARSCTSPSPTARTCCCSARWPWASSAARRARP